MTSSRDDFENSQPFYCKYTNYFRIIYKLGPDWWTKIGNLTSIRRVIFSGTLWSTPCDVTFAAKLAIQCDGTGVIYQQVDFLTKLLLYLNDFILFFCQKKMWCLFPPPQFMDDPTQYLKATKSFVSDNKMVQEIQYKISGKIYSLQFQWYINGGRNVYHLSLLTSNLRLVLTRSFSYT